MARLINGILVSHDYEDLMKELKADIAEFSPELVGIVRGEETAGYSPIIDYYFPGDEVAETAVWLKPEEVISEMEELNDIF